METLPTQNSPLRLRGILELFIGLIVTGFFLFSLYLLFATIITNVNGLTLHTKDQTAENSLPQTTHSQNFVNLINNNQPRKETKPTITTDTKPPVISESYSVRTTNNLAIIAWSTDEPSTSQIEYGTSTDYNKKSSLDSKTVKDHSIELNELNADTKYHFRMLSKDTAGNLATSKDYTFDTPASKVSPLPPVTPPTPPVPPAPPAPPAPPRIEAGVTKKVMALIFNPIIESAGGKKLIELKGWNDPTGLDQTYINDVRTASGGYVNYQIAINQEIDNIPTKADGFKYTDQTYLDCMNNTTTCHNPDGVDYLEILTDYDVCGKRNSGEIDELWLWGGPYFGYYESILAGPGAFWYNAPALSGSSCSKQLPIMGFNYERGVSEMIEDLGHRTESVMRQVYGSWEAQPTHAWNRFTLLDKDRPGEAACGNIHFGPNSTSDYDWSNSRTVSSNCEDWLNYPSLTGTKEQFNCSKWGCDGYGYKRWWFSHLPRYGGKTDGKWNNWWRYILDYEGSTN